MQKSLIVLWSCIVLTGCALEFDPDALAFDEEPEDFASPNNTPNNTKDPESPCANQGDPCTPIISDNETFQCVRGGDTLRPNDAICLERCTISPETDSCPEGAFCSFINIDTSLCFSSNCTSPFDSEEECADAGPEGGTCFTFNGDTRFCIQAGRVREGGECVRQNECASGLVCLGGICERFCSLESDEVACFGDNDCVRATTDSEVGVCGTPCDTFDTEGVCQPGQVCDLSGSDEGFCSNNRISPTPPAFGECFNPGLWCEQSVLCINVDLQGNSRCIPVCRVSRGNEDCPDGTACQRSNFVNQDFGICIQ